MVRVFIYIHFKSYRQGGDALEQNWIISNLEAAFDTWNLRLKELSELLLMSPEEFRGGSIWKIIKSVFDAMKGIGLSLMVLFFVIGILRSCTDFSELKRPERSIRLLLRFVLTKAILTYGMDLVLMTFRFFTGVGSKLMGNGLINDAMFATVPEKIKTAVEGLNIVESVPVWAVTLLGSIFITVISFVMILTVYGRFFRIYLYTAFSPIALSPLAGEGMERSSYGFIRSFMGVMLEGALLILSFIIYSRFISSPGAYEEGMELGLYVWKYLAETVFSMLVLLGSVKASDRLSREIFGG